MDLVAAAISLFAFTSVVANYAYGESNLNMFKMDNKLGRTAYTMGYLLMILWGSMAALPEVWAMADMALGLMTVINITALVLMTPTIVSLVRTILPNEIVAKKLVTNLVIVKYRVNQKKEFGISYET